jgi:hypothetical protein
MSDNSHVTNLPKPNPALRKLDRLVGTWNCKGYDTNGCEIYGKEKYEWMDGGFFLKHEIEQHYAGMMITGIQIIGFFRQCGDDQPSEICTSHLFDNMGNAWEYVWEIDDNAITIWTGYIGSPATYRGGFSNNGNILSGRWSWPGGGYESTLTRVMGI